MFVQSSNGVPNLQFLKRHIVREKAVQVTISQFGAAREIEADYTRELLHKVDYLEAAGNNCLQPQSRFLLRLE